MAIDFTSATSDKILCGDVDTLDGQAEITLAAWVKLSTAKAYATAIAKQSASTSRFYMFARSTGVDARCGVANGSDTYNQTDTAPFIVGQWQHWCMVFDGALSPAADRVSFWVDGSEVSWVWTSSLPSTTATNAGQLCLGNTTNGNAYLNGVMEDCAVWNTALTQEEINLLAVPRVKAMPLKVQPSSLQGYWPMDELAAGTAVPATADQVRDLSGNGNHGTKSGSPTYAEGALSRPGSLVCVSPQAAGDVTVTPGALPLALVEHSPTVLADVVHAAPALELTSAINDPSIVLPSAGAAARVTLIEDDLHM